MQAKRSKFNVDKKTESRTFNGIIFDSVIEMKYYRDVVLPGIESGDIIGYELQKMYQLQPAYIHLNKKIQPIEYKADFYLKYKNGKEVIIDIKGCPDSVAILKRKMFWYIFPELDYRWLVYVKKFGGWIDYDECNRLRRAEKKRKRLCGD